MLAAFTSEVQDVIFPKFLGQLKSLASAEEIPAWQDELKKEVLLAYRPIMSDPQEEKKPFAVEVLLQVDELRVAAKQRAIELEQDCQTLAQIVQSTQEQIKFQKCLKRQSDQLKQLEQLEQTQQRLLSQAQNDLANPFSQVEECEQKILQLIQTYTKLIKAEKQSDQRMKTRVTDHFTERKLKKNLKFPGAPCWENPICGFQHVDKDTRKFYGFNPILRDGTNAGLKPSGTDASDWREVKFDIDLHEVRKIIIHGRKDSSNIGQIQFLDTHGKELVTAGILDKDAISQHGISKTYDLKEGERIVGYHGHVDDTDEGFVQDLQFVIGWYE